MQRSAMNLFEKRGHERISHKLLHSLSRACTCVVLAVPVPACVNVCDCRYAVAGLCSAVHVYACVCQVGSRETSLASLTVSVAQSKLTIRSLVFAFVVRHVTAGTSCLASPRFFCLAFISMAHMPRWDICWSSYNLTSFLTWFRSYATEEEQLGALHLYTVEHRRTVPKWLAARGVVPQDVPLQVTYKGAKVDFPQRKCSEPGCERCASGRGGYQFRWVDRRWTPSAALDLRLTPLEVQDEMYKSWPRGLLPIPRDRLPLLGASSSSTCSSPEDSAESGSHPAAWNARVCPEPPVEPAAHV